MIPLTTKQVLKKLGGDKKSKTITYDGSGVGIDVFGNGNLYLKVSDETFDFSTVKSISLIVDGRTWGFEKGDLVIDPGTADSFPTIIIPGFNQVVVFYAPPGIELDAGLYIAASPAAYVSRITFETIHPIDQEFLPGVCLPVVELTTEPTADGAALTAEESARMDEVAAMGLPIVLKMPFPIGETYAPVAFAASFVMGAFVAPLSSNESIQVANPGTGWLIGIA